MANIDWLLTWNTVLAIATALMASAIIVTAIFAVRQLLHIRDTRCSDLLMRLHQTWDSNEYIQSRRLINKYSEGSTPEEASQNLKESIKSFLEANAREFFIMLRLANFFENLGYLTYKGYLDHKQALELFGSAAKRYWGLFLGYVNYQRNERPQTQPDAWIYFEGLVRGFPKKNKCLEILKAPILKICKQLSKDATK